MSKKLPAFQLYPGDWRKDPGVQALDYEYRGVWFEMLLLMHESDQRGKLLLNGNAMPDEALARLLGLDKQKLSKIKSTLLDYGVASTCEDTGALMNRRMVRDEEIREKRREAGKKGGNPNLVKQKSSKPKKEVNQSNKQSSTPSSSTSSSTSKNNSPPSAGAGDGFNPGIIDPPDSPEKVKEIGSMKNIPPDECEMYFEMRSVDNFMRMTKDGAWKPIPNWHADLAHCHRKGYLTKKKQKSKRKGGSNGSIDADQIIRDTEEMFADG